jgi:hypothetical protein
MTDCNHNFGQVASLSDWVEQRVATHHAGSIESIYDTWVAMNKPKTFIEYWMDATGNDTKSPEFQETMNWIVTREIMK